jgi:hypothetical protein
VIEEFSFVDKAFEKGKKARLVPHTEMFWGNHYFYDREYNANNLLRNYWITKTEMAARYALPFLKNIDYLLPESEKNLSPQKLNKGMGMEEPINY